MEGSGLFSSIKQNKLNRCSLTYWLLHLFHYHKCLNYLFMKKLFQHQVFFRIFHAWVTTCTGYSYTVQFCQRVESSQWTWFSCLTQPRWSSWLLICIVWVKARNCSFSFCLKCCLRRLSSGEDNPRAPGTKSWWHEIAFNCERNYKSWDIVLLFLL